MHIELLIFYLFIHYSCPSYSFKLFSNSSQHCADFFVQCGSKYPKYPSFSFTNKWAYLGVPPRMAKKNLHFMMLTKASKYSTSGFSKPILAITKITMFSLLLGISSRKMLPSLQTITLQVRLNFYKTFWIRKPASLGEYHSQGFLWGNSWAEDQVRTWIEKGMQLLSQQRGMTFLGSAPSLLHSKLARAICTTLSIHPQPASEVQVVVARSLRMLDLQVSLTNSSSSLMLGPNRLSIQLENIPIAYYIMHTSKQYNQTSVDCHQNWKPF